MEREAFQAVALDIMRRAEFVALATVEGEGYPFVRALFNLRNPGIFPSLAAFHEGKGLAVFLGTNTSSVKVGQAARFPRASAYFAIPSEVEGLCLSGELRLDEGAKRSLWIEGWERYYPLGREDPDYAVLRLDPVRARGWRGGEAFDRAL